MERIRIAVVAPGGRIAPETAERAQTLIASHYPPEALQIHFHPQCFAAAGHFAGDDRTRADALVEVANDPSFDAVWFARGGYGACRIAADVIGRLDEPAKAKTYLGYSDTGVLLGALYKAGIGRPVHGPMPGDINRAGGEAAVLRGLAFLTGGEGLEGSLEAGVPRLAYNAAVLSSVLGTPLEPTFAGHVLMIEEVSEYMYRLDRYLFHITSSPAVRTVAGIRLGRISAVPPNDPDFGLHDEAVMQDWCARAAIPYLGRADIGHDIDNKIVPFGAD